jgi:ATP-binding cassette subfamily F protein uup
VSSAPAPTLVGERREKAGARTNAARVKLSYKGSRELEQLPAEIEALEREQHELTAGMSRADYHKQGAERIKADRKRSQEIERQLVERFERWAQLDEKAAEQR